MYKKNRVILIFPDPKMRGQKADRPPLGILTVAAPLVKKDMDVCILDERVEPDFDTRLSEELKKGPVCVGISSMSGRYITSALRISRLIKQQSNVPIVWGGVHPSLEPDSTIRHELVDIIVLDDGEETLPKLIEALKDPSADLRNIHGICFKRNGQAVMTEPAEPARIENLPLIPFNLVDLNKYNSQEPWTKEKNLLPVETSRGCPFSCSFCTESMRKKKWRSLSPERVVRDIKEYVKKYSISSFTFIDDNFFGDIKRGERIVELLIKEDIGIEWYTNMRPDYMAGASLEFVVRLKKSGCRMLTFGAESGSPRILKMINKHTTREQIIATNRNLVGSGIFPHFVTIRGFPAETPADAAQTLLLNIQLLLENEKAICDSPFLIVTPGTIIARQCLQGKAADYTLEDWAKIFDTEASDIHFPWLSVKTCDFIKRYAMLTNVIHRTNRKDISWLENMLFRFILRLSRVILRRGYNALSYT